MFRRILVANRGEVALRIIRACKEMGIDTVAIYSQADRGASYLRLADHTVCIGPGPAKDSYLDPSRIISAAEVTNVDAIHPGYGFLSENPEFAEICESCNIRFIGPPAEAMRLAGDKVQARETAKKVKIPTIPGSEGPVEDEKEALDVAKSVGYPVMIKAAGGGGGRGMRVVHNDVSLVQAFLKAKSEVAAAFKNPTLYVEKFIPNARHIEVQILGDRPGTLIHLGERDCTIQRRFQKLIEEAPSPAVSSSLRRDLGNSAVAFAKACGYHSAGTVEFLVDEKGRYYFIEMNSRLQVEHPVTEMVTGIDLVKEQIRLADGEKLGYSQRDIRWNGFAIECRINAEDPSNGFRPCPGRIEKLQFPGGPGVRVDSHAFTGYEVPPFYDSLIAKVVVHRPTHEEAVSAMRSAIRELIVDGLKTTRALHLSILNHPRYINGQIHTSFVDSVFGRGTSF